MYRVSPLTEFPVVVYIAAAPLVAVGALFLFSGFSDVDSEYQYAAVGIGAVMAVCGLALLFLAGALRRSEPRREAGNFEEELPEEDEEDEESSEFGQEIEAPAIERDYGGFVECTTKGDGANVCLMTAFLAVIGGASSAFSYFSSDVIYNPFGLICLAIAAVASVSCMRHIARWKKFGVSRFRFAKNPRAGREFSGTVITDKEVVAKGDYKAVLICQETVRVRSGKNRKSKTYVRWSEESIINGRAYRSRSGIPISFGIPDDALSSRDTRATGEVQWLLTLSAPTTGVNFAAEFRLLVRGNFDRP